MEKQFVKLKIHHENKYLYLRPEGIAALSWNDDEKSTRLFYTAGHKVGQATVEETPGFIFDKCNKVLTRNNSMANYVRTIRC